MRDNDRFDLRQSAFGDADVDTVLRPLDRGEDLGLARIQFGPLHIVFGLHEAHRIRLVGHVVRGFGLHNLAIGGLDTKLAVSVILLLGRCVELDDNLAFLDRSA